MTASLQSHYRIRLVAMLESSQCPLSEKLRTRIVAKMPYGMLGPDDPLVGIAMSLRSEALMRQHVLRMTWKASNSTSPFKYHCVVLTESRECFGFVRIVCHPIRRLGGCFWFNVASLRVVRWSSWRNISVVWWRNRLKRGFGLIIFVHCTI